MTRIRNFLLRGRRFPRVHGLKAVSFEAFSNEATPEKHKIPKDSHPCDGYNLSPRKLNNCDDSSYSAEVPPSKCPLGVSAVLIIMLLMAVFLVLPTVYILYCFGVIYIDHKAHDFNVKHLLLKDEVHYEPSYSVHSLLQNSDVTDSEFITDKAVPPPPSPNYTQCKMVKLDERFDCFPDDGANQKACEARGCCWMQPSGDLEVPLNYPYCFYPPNFPTYKVENVTETDFGLVAFLNRNYKSPYPDDVEVVKLIVKYETESRLHIKIVDPLHFRFEPPYPDVPIVDRAAINLKYVFILDRFNSGFKVMRRSDNVTLFDTVGFQNLIYSNQFLQISSKLPSKYIYGIGEHRSSLLLSTQWSRFTLFNHDTVPSFNKNLYGSHPFYMVLENSTKAHGVFLLNSNAMDVILQPTPAITFRTVGGIFDFYFFLGSTPADVVSQYTDLIGRPYMPPYWGLGFHLCRFGYKTLNRTKMIMQRNIDAGIPLDTQWNDLDYMNNSNDFTYDHKNFDGLPEFVSELHNRNMHYIPLIDPGVSASEPRGQYPPFDQGLAMDIFVKNSSGQPFIGKVWNKASTAWPDFTHPDAVNYWTVMLTNLHKQIAFDGAWIDMNEPSNFLSGSFNGCPNNNLEHPPYVPGVEGGVLNYKTMCMNAKHYAGLHYDVHNLYGFSEAIVTSFAMAEIRGKRPFVISRSTFAGHGHYAGHWSGDVFSEWLDMRYTIPQLLSFSLFGIPLMGADICGFNGNTTKELCNRWMQLGAFYPFSRNHNTDDGIDQDPAAFDTETLESAKEALKIRYSLLPYLYTLFWKAHVNGETVARPLFFEFTSDLTTYGIDTQFLWGPALMICPVLQENVTSVSCYLPSGVWYDYYTKKSIISKGNSFNISVSYDSIPLFIRGGFILPLQTPAQTTTETRKNLVRLIVAPDQMGNAEGVLYWDDGDSLNTYEEKRYSVTNFTMEPGILRISNVYNQDIPPNLNTVRILGVTNVKVVTVNMHRATFIDTSRYIVIEELYLPLKDPIVITWN